jgi:hypothetical protein
VAYFNERKDKSKLPTYICPMQCLPKNAYENANWMVVTTGSIWGLHTLVGCKRTPESLRAAVMHDVPAKKKKGWKQVM